MNVTTARNLLVVMTALVTQAAGCGGKQPTPAGSGGDTHAGVVTDTRSPIEKRRDAACDALGPRITQCAVEDARAEVASGKTTQKQFELDTAPEVLRKNTDEFAKSCKVSMSSRQVRVLEVCKQEETECGPLLDCLGHLDDRK
jgi:hypothetical protein